MSSNFRHIRALTTELAAVEHLKIDVSAIFRLLLIRSIVKFEVAKLCMISCMSSTFGHIGPLTNKFHAIESLKNKRTPINQTNNQSIILFCACLLKVNIFSDS